MSIDGFSSGGCKIAGDLLGVVDDVIDTTLVRLLDFISNVSEIIFDSVASILLFLFFAPPVQLVAVPVSSSVAGLLEVVEPVSAFGVPALLFGPVTIVFGPPADAVSLLPPDPIVTVAAEPYVAVLGMLAVVATLLHGLVVVVEVLSHTRFKVDAVAPVITVRLAPACRSAKFIIAIRLPILVSNAWNGFIAFVLGIPIILGFRGGLHGVGKGFKGG